MATNFLYPSNSTHTEWLKARKDKNNNKLITCLPSSHWYELLGAIAPGKLSTLSTQRKACLFKNMGHLLGAYALRVSPRTLHMGLYWLCYALYC
jgi:hypothetical protein